MNRIAALITTTRTQLLARLEQAGDPEAGLETVEKVVLIVIGVGIATALGAFLVPWVQSKIGQIGN